MILSATYELMFSHKTPVNVIVSEYVKISDLKDLQKFQFFRKKLNFGRKCFFRKNQFSSKTWKEPQGRVFVVQSSYGAHSTGNCLYFAFGIK